MVFTLIALILATLFGVFFGAEGQLPAEIQTRAFFGIIFTGISVHALQILRESLCRQCNCVFCNAAA